jgi:hypothetical protein
LIAAIVTVWQKKDQPLKTARVCEVFLAFHSLWIESRENPIRKAMQMPKRNAI